MGRGETGKTPRVWSLRTLGAFALALDGRELSSPPTQKARALLAYIAWHRGADHARERIIELFWPECEPERGRSSLNTALWSIRRCIRDAGIDPETVITANKTRISWLPEIEVDIRTFESLASDASAGALTTLGLYRGDFLEGDYGEWSVAQREHAASTYERLLDHAVLLESDIPSARRLMDRGSFEEAPYALVIAAEVVAGHLSAAAATIRRYRDTLAGINAVPSAEFEARFAGIRATSHDPIELTMSFAGRVRELAAMVAAFRRVGTGAGAIVVLQGAAGSGKTELLRQAERAANDASIRTIVVAAIPDDARAFGPWASVYEHGTGASFSDFAASGGDATALALALEERLGPAAFFVDDAHYLSGDALEVLGILAQRAVRSTSLLIVAMRPDGPRGRTARFPSHQRIVLEPLTHDDVRAALGRVAPEHVAMVSEFLYQRSGGHPFFAAKLLESLVQSGALQRERGLWSPSTTLSESIQTPPSIRAFIEERLFAKGDAPAIVACALALEPSATSEHLIAVCGLGESPTLDAIDDLLGLDLIEQPHQGAEFRFRHDLICEAAARTLNSGRRVRLHRAFAELFAGDEHRESQVRRARHLRASGRLLEAAQSFAQAAYSVMEMSAWRDALDWVNAGAEALQQLTPTDATNRLLCDLHEIATRACEEAAMPGESFRHANERVSYAREVHDGALICRALIRRATVTMETSPPEHALGDIREALELANALEDDHLRALAFIRHSICRQFCGNGEEAVESARKALLAARRATSARWIMPAMERLMTVLCIWHGHGEATALAEPMLELARQAAPRSEAIVRIRRASLWYLMERWQDAQSELQIVSGILNATQTRIRMPELIGLNISLLRFLHEAQRATLALAERAWNVALAAAEDLLANPAGRAHNRSGTAELYAIEALLGRDQPGDAQRAYTLAKTLPAEPSPPGLVGMSLTAESAHARIAVRLRHEDAPLLLRKAFYALTLQAQRMPMDVDLALANLADAAAELGMTAFEAELRENARMFRSLRLTFASSQHSKNPSSASPA